MRYEEARPGAPLRGYVDCLWLPHFILLRPARRIDTIGVRFRPAGARRFFREPADRLAGQFIALEDLWGSDARRLLARLQEASGRAERLRIVEDALLAAFRDDAPDRAVAETCEWILRNAGRVSVREAARNVRLSERSLERRFRNELGLSPKVFARIVRLQGVLRAVGRCEQPDWAGVAADCSYFDQPHLIPASSGRARARLPRSSCATRGGCP